MEQSTCAPIGARLRSAAGRFVRAILPRADVNPHGAPA